MRIGLISGEFPPDQGGVGDFTLRLGEALTVLGHETHVITAARNTQHELRQLGMKHATHPNLTIHRTISSWGWGCWRQVLAMARKLALDALDLQFQTTAYGMHPAIHFVPPPAGRPPLVVTFHDLKVPYLFPKAGPLRWRIVRMLARRADGVIVTNQEDYMRMAPQISSPRLTLIPIGSNIFRAPPPDYDRDIERARWGVGPTDLLLGYFGFLNESKGGEELIEALALLVEGGIHAHLLMVGGRVGSSDPTNQAYAARVDALIARLGLEARVHWTGYDTPEAVSAGLLATDVCVLPYRDGVSFRRGTLHACLTHGRAIVTTLPTVDLPQVQDGRNMLLVPPRDAAALAAAAARLWRDSALRAQLESGATALAAEFTWERIARQTALLFDRVKHGAAG